MSMISEQVKELRDCVRRWQNFESVSSSEPFKLLSQAADTIEALSAKLQAANVENGGGRILCEDRLPEENGRYIACLGHACARELTFEDGRWSNSYIDNEYLGVTAWQPLSEPYRP